MPMSFAVPGTGQVIALHLNDIGPFAISRNINRWIESPGRELSLTRGGNLLLWRLPQERGEHVGMEISVRNLMNAHKFAGGH
jgi:hypothetical protein